MQDGLFVGIKVGHNSIMSLRGLGRDLTLLNPSDSYQIREFETMSDNHCSKNHGVVRQVSLLISLIFIGIPTERAFIIQVETSAKA